MGRGFCCAVLTQLLLQQHFAAVQLCHCVLGSQPVYLSVNSVSGDLTSSLATTKSDEPLSPEARKISQSFDNCSEQIKISKYLVQARLKG